MERQEKKTESLEAGSLLRKLIMHHIDNVMKKAPNWLLPVEQRRQFNAYANGLAYALYQVDQVLAANHRYANNLETRGQMNQLDNAVQNLQRLVLQPQLPRGDAENLMEYVKELRQGVDDLLNISSSDAKKQVIEEHCREIKAEADRVLRYCEEFGRDAASINVSNIDNVYYVVDGFERSTDERVKNMISQIKNTQLVNLDNTCNRLRIATLSSISNRRVAVLNRNLLDILILEDKIREMQYENSTPGSYVQTPVPWSTQSALLRAMFNLAMESGLRVTLMEYMDEQRLRTNLTNTDANKQLRNHLESVTRPLKDLIVGTRSAAVNFDFTYNEGYNILTKVFEEIRNRCNFGSERIDPMSRKSHLKHLLDPVSPSCYKSNEGLEALASRVISSFEKCIANTKDTQKETYSSSSYEIKIFITEARAMKKADDVVYNAYIEEAVREVVVQMLNVYEAIELVNQVLVQQKSMVKANIPKVLVKVTSESISPLQRIISGITASGASGSQAGRFPESSPFPSTGGMSPAQIRERFSMTECAGKYSEPEYPISIGIGGGDGDAGGSGGSSSQSAPTSDDPDVQSSSSNPSLVSLPPDPQHNQVYHRQFFDALQSLNEAMNNLCRIASRRKLQLDCRELLRNLDLQEAFLNFPLPTCDLSYAECERALSMYNEEIIPLLNSDEPMPLPTFWRSLRYVSTVVCKYVDFVIQCAYFILISEQDSSVANTGLVDVVKLKNLVQAAQTTCYKMMILEATQVDEQSTHLLRQIQQLRTALTEAGKRGITMQGELESAAKAVYDCAMKLHRSLDQEFRTVILPNITELLIRLRVTGELADHPKLAPPAPATSSSTLYSDNCLRRAGSLIGATKNLITDVRNGESSVDHARIRWIDYDFARRALIEEFKSCLINVRSAGLHAETEEE